MRMRIQDARGMTLVELMIVLIVFSMVMGAILSLFTTSLTAYWKGDLATQVQQGGRVSLERLTRDLRQGRRLITGTTAGGFTFNLQCSPSAPQISFVLPHMATVTLSDNSTVYATDPNAAGTVPYDGSYVSYYLAAAPGSTTLSQTGPYLIRAAWDLVASTLSTATIANNVTALAFQDRATGNCPTAAARDVKVTVTASQTATGQNVSSTDVVQSDVALRNQ